LEVENNQTEYNLYAKLLPYYKKHFKRNGKTSEFEQSANKNKAYYDFKNKKNSLEPIDISLIQNDNEFAVELSEVIFLQRAILAVYDEAFSRIKTLHKNIETELNKK
jgi:hypothetical protein